MLTLAKDIHTLDARIRQGHWDKAGYRGTELFKKTLGIVGFGRIGRRLKELVAPLKMEILVYDPVIRSDRVPPDVTLVNSLEAFLPSADIVSVHCPLTEQTRCLIGERELGMMKRTACYSAELN
jgi:D-3-phosphoglycerate dehydrogenase